MRELIIIIATIALMLFSSCENKNLIIINGNQYYIRKTCLKSESYFVKHIGNKSEYYTKESRCLETKIDTIIVE